MKDIELISQIDTINTLLEGELPWPLIVSLHRLQNGGDFRANWISDSKVQFYVYPKLKGKNSVGYITPDANPDDFPPWLLPYILTAQKAKLPLYTPNPSNGNTMFSIALARKGKFTEGTDPSIFDPSILPLIQVLQQHGYGG